MELLTVKNPAMDQNIYIYYHPATKAGIVIDAGDNFAGIMAAIEKHDMTVKAIMLTHAHYDHMFSAKQLKAATSAPIYCHADEKVFMENPSLNLSALTGHDITITPDIYLGDGEIIALAGTTLQVIHTPGHTPGGACFYDQSVNLVFTGDTLFKSSIGRSDFPQGNHTTLIQSIQTKLLTLPTETKIYPGHGASSTIADEKSNNPFL